MSPSNSSNSSVEGKEDLSATEVTGTSTEIEIEGTAAPLTEAASSPSSPFPTTLQIPLPGQHQQSFHRTHPPQSVMHSILLFLKIRKPPSIPVAPILTPLKPLPPSFASVPEVFVQVLGSNYRRSKRAIQKTVRLVLRNAVSHCYITTPYFLPPTQLKHAIIQCAKNGTQVIILTSVCQFCCCGCCCVGCSGGVCVWCVCVCYVGFVTGCLCCCVCML